MKGFIQGEGGSWKGYRDKILSRAGARYEASEAATSGRSIERRQSAIVLNIYSSIFVEI